MSTATMQEPDVQVASDERQAAILRLESLRARKQEAWAGLRREAIRRHWTDTFSEVMTHLGHEVDNSVTVEVDISLDITKVVEKALGSKLTTYLRPDSPGDLSLRGSALDLRHRMRLTFPGPKVQMCLCSYVVSSGKVEAKVKELGIPFDSLAIVSTACLYDARY